MCHGWLLTMFGLHLYLPAGTHVVTITHLCKKRCLLVGEVATNVGFAKFYAATTSALTTGRQWVPGKQQFIHAISTPFKGPPFQAGSRAPDQKSDFGHASSA